MNSLERNHTCTLLRLPEALVLISCKWLFKVNYNETDGGNRYKARLVARGFSRKAGFDYTDTHSPVARLDIVRVVPAAANEQRMTVHRTNAKSAFLNDNLEIEI